VKAGETGRLGEDEACRFLMSRGYEILERNFRCRFGEIDIVARCPDCVVFVEVKTRRDRRFAEAAQAVGPSKQQKLRAAALYWFSVHGEVPARFDVIEIYTGGAAPQSGTRLRPTEVRHIKNAF
jgi:putative endonuclease